MPYPVHSYGMSEMAQWLMPAMMKKWGAGEDESAKQKALQQQISLEAAKMGAGGETGGAPDQMPGVKGMEGMAINAPGGRMESLFGGAAGDVENIRRTAARRLRRQELNAHTDRSIEMLKILDKLSPQAQLNAIDIINEGYEGTGFRVTDVNNAKDAIDQMKGFSLDAYYKALGTARENPTTENMRDFNDTASIVARHSKLFPQIDLKEDRKSITSAVERDQKKKAATLQQTRKIALKKIAPGKADVADPAEYRKAQLLYKDYTKDMPKGKKPLSFSKWWQTIYKPLSFQQQLGGFMGGMLGGETRGVPEF